MYDEFTGDQRLRMGAMLSEISDDLHVLCLQGRENMIKTGSGGMRHFSSYAFSGSPFLYSESL
jgi:hypothetical protein